ncbi:MAG: hypothetical protein Q4G42_08580 [Neisseria sp.]|nr:hypothetical protein [Neisseria sp.]
MIKAVNVMRLNKNESWIFFALSLIIVAFFVIELFQYFNHENKFKYWDEMIAVNPKPISVSDQEFKEKNLQGYCWRDKKYYTMEELKEKAMVGLSRRMLETTEFYRNEQVLNANDEIDAETDVICRRYPYYCRVWFYPKKTTDKELRDLINNHKNTRENYHKLNHFLQNNTIELTKDSGLENKKIIYGADYSLIVTYYLAGDIYSSECCEILSKDDLRKINIKGLATKKVGSSPIDAEIPVDIYPESLGVGNYFLQVDFYTFYFDSQEGYKNYYKNVFFLSNCGDLLFKPYYIVDS